MNFKQIYEGWRNKLVPPAHLRDTINKVSEERLEICKDCEWHSSKHNTPTRPDDHCTNCGCNLDAKSKCLSCSCPLDHWGSVIEYEDEQKFKQDAYEIPES